MIKREFQISQGVFTPGGSGDYYKIGDSFDDLMEACFKFVDLCNDRGGYTIGNNDTLDTILEIVIFDTDSGDIEYEGILYTQFNRRGRLITRYHEDIIPDLILDKIDLKDDR